MSVQAIAINSHEFQVQKVNDKTGQIGDVQKFSAEHVLEPKAIGTAISTVVRTAPNMRKAWLSFLALVWGEKKLDGYRGTGNRVEGNLSKELKSSVRSAEETVVMELVAQGFLKLPKAGSDEEALQQFLGELRDDKNYSNAKNLANRFMAFVGEPMVNGEGFLLPAPYMQARIKEVLDAAKPQEENKLPPITSLLAKAEAEFKAIDIGTDDVVHCLPILRRMLADMEGIQRDMAEAATQVRGNVPAAAAAAMVKAAEPAAAKADEPALI